MLKDLIHSKHPSIDEFIKILKERKFNQKDAERVLPKINKNYRFENGDTLLDMCLRNNRFKAASWLVMQGVEITNRNKDNISTVRLAIEKGDIIVIDNLVKYADFNINQVDDNGRSLLQDAVILGYNEISKILIEKDIDVNIKDKYNRNVIFDAINYGSGSLVDTILEVDGLELNNIDVNGQTVLHQKSVLKNDNLAIKLLQKGADPTICGKDGYNFLTHTALRGDDGKRVLDTAIEQGCNLNAKNPDENTVLLEVMTAFTRSPKVEVDKRTELKNVAQNLINSGSDINAVNKHGESILFELVRKGDFDGCIFILENGIDPNQPNRIDETPLQIAVLKGIKYIEIIKILLKYDADPTIKNRYQETVPEILNDIILHIHKFKSIKDREYLIDIDFNGQYMIILKEIITQEKFNFHYLGIDGNPLFFKPFLYGDLNTTKLYLQNGFDINERNEEGVNLFYEYVLKCFEEGEYFKEFKSFLTYLLVNKSDIRVKNKNGQIIHLRVALIKNCNIRLFRKLVELTKLDYMSVDNMGKTIIHACVMSNNTELYNFVYGVERNIQNIADQYNILPITYAALLGRQEIVLDLLKKDTIINSGKPIAQSMKEKLKPMIKNLDKLSEGVEDPVLLRQLAILKEQTIKDLQ
jgi:ankyrin repeat protein